MELYSFKKLKDTDSISLEEAVRKKTERVLKGQCFKKFNFNVDFFVMDDSYAFLGSKANTNGANPFAFKYKSSIYKFDIHDDILDDFMELELAISHLETVPTMKSLFVVSENRVCQVIHRDTKKILHACTLAEDLNNLITVSFAPKLYYSMGNKIYVMSGRNHRFKHRLIANCEFGVKRFDVIRGLDAFLVLTPAGQLIIYDKKIKMLYKFNSQELPPILDFQLQEEVNQIAFRTDSKIQIWSLKGNQEDAKAQLKEIEDHKQIILKNDEGTNIIGDGTYDSDSDEEVDFGHQINHIKHLEPDNYSKVKIQYMQQHYSEIKNSDSHSNTMIEGNISLNNENSKRFSTLDHYDQLELYKNFRDSQEIKTYDIENNLGGNWTYIGSDDVLLAHSNNENCILKLSLSAERSRLLGVNNDCSDLKYCPSTNRITFIDTPNAIHIYSFNSQNWENFSESSECLEQVDSFLLDSNEKTAYVWWKGHIRQYDVNRTILLQTFKLNDNAISCFVLDGYKARIFAASCEGWIYEVEINPLSLVTQFQAYHSFSTVCLASLGHNLVSISSTSAEVKLWNIEGQVRAKPDKTYTLSSAGNLTNLCVSEIHNFIIASKSNSLIFLHKDKGILKETSCHKNEILTLAITENDKLASTCSEEMIVWSLPNMITLSRIEFASMGLIKRIGNIGNGICIWIDHVGNHLNFLNFEEKSIANLAAQLSIYETTHLLPLSLKTFRFGPKQGKVVFLAKDGKFYEVSVRNDSLNEISEMFSNQNFEYLYNQFNNKLSASTEKSLHQLDSKLLSRSIKDAQTIKKPKYNLKNTLFLKRYNLMIVVALNGRTIEVFDVSKYRFKQTISFESYIICFELMEELNLLMVANIDNSIVKIRIPDFSIIQDFKTEVGSSIECMRSSETSQHLYFGCMSGKIYKWRFNEKARPKQLGSHVRCVSCMAIAKGKNFLISCSVDKSFKVWDLANSQLTRTFVAKDYIENLLLHETLNLLFINYGKTNYLKFVLDMDTFEEILPSGNNANLHYMDQSYTIATCNAKTMKIVKTTNGSLSPSYEALSSTKKFYQFPFLERTYIELFFLNKTPANKFMLFFRKLKSVYERSHLLTNYFNIYLAAALNNNDESFKSLFIEDKIPYTWIEGQISPLAYLLKINNIETMKNVLRMFSKQNVCIPLEEELFEYLLTTSENFGRTFLRKNIQTKSRFDCSASKIRKLGKFGPYAIFVGSVHKFYQDHFEQLLLSNLKTTRYIKIFDLNIRWDFSEFTSKSILFLEQYSQSDDDEFIMSPYCHIISYKWERFKYVFVAQAIVYWLHLLFFFLFLTNNQTMGFLVVDFIMIGLLLVYEILNYCSTGRNYFRDSLNYYDIISICSSIVFLTLTIYESEYLSNAIYQIFLLMTIMIISWRGFIFFKHFSGFSHITQMTIGMIRNSLSIIFITIYFALCLSIMMSKTITGDSFVESLELNYNLVFGNMPSFDNKHYLHLFLIVLGSLLLPIFLLNFLIAKLSGTYSSLENRQKVLVFKELAYSLLEIEKIGQFLYRLLKKPIQINSGFVYLAVDEKVIQKINEASHTDKLVKEISEHQKRVMKDNYNLLSSRIDQMSDYVTVSNKELQNQMNTLAKTTSDQITELLKSLSTKIEQSESKFSKLEQLLQSKYTSTLEKELQKTSNDK